MLFGQAARSARDFIMFIKFIMCHDLCCAAQAALLPLLTLAALKNVAIRDGVEVRADERSAVMMQVGGGAGRRK